MAEVPHCSSPLCPRCGGKKATTSKLCRACYFAAREETVQLHCAQCSTAFAKPLYEHEKSLRRGHKDFYCSEACSQAHHAVKNAKKCVSCQQPVTAKGRCRNATYCSLECRRAASAKPLATCPQCEGSFRARSVRHTYCSRACSNASHSERMLGAGNSHYKDGQSYALWFSLARLLALGRDETCVACRSAKRLIVHHINHQPADNRVENLVVLCRTCHAEHHKSHATPFPWLGDYTAKACRSMTSKWRAQATSLLEKFSSTTA